MSCRRWIASIVSSCIVAGTGCGANVHAATQDPEGELHRAARAGDSARVRARLAQGVRPDVQDAAGRTALHEAVAAGKLESVDVLLAAGANVDAPSRAGRTPLVEAAQHGHLDAARRLIDAGADLNRSHRGSGTAVETAERNGQNEVAAMLRQAGARSSGRSPGDTVCVRPWNGNGYCGLVESLQKTAVRMLVTELVGCKAGCAPHAECSGGREVGGKSGLRVGDVVTTVSWCLTHTRVQR